jgi:hypothetical protein
MHISLRYENSVVHDSRLAAAAFCKVITVSVQRRFQQGREQQRQRLLHHRIHGVPAVQAFAIDHHGFAWTELKAVVQQALDETLGLRWPTLSQIPDAMVGARTLARFRARAGMRSLRAARHPSSGASRWPCRHDAYV